MHRLIKDSPVWVLGWSVKDTGDFLGMVDRINACRQWHSLCTFVEVGWRLRRQVGKGYATEAAIFAAICIRSVCGQTDLCLYSGWQ